MEARKQAIMAALDKFVAQRPGLEFGNYGDVSAYRSEMRGITRDRHDYNVLARAVERSDSITADMLLHAFPSAFGGRLLAYRRDTAGSLVRACPRDTFDGVTLEYVADQYFPTEYRKAACAVLASALWAHVRENCMPAPNGFMVREWGNRHAHWGPFSTREEAETQRATLALPTGKEPGQWGGIDQTYGPKALGAQPIASAYFRREFGRSIANRWFS